MPRRKFEQMPFEHDGGLDFPKRKKAKECDPKPRQTMKQKQRSWVLNGLKHLRAPAATPEFHTLDVLALWDYPLNHGNQFIGNF